MTIKKMFKKVCPDCEKLFRPTGKYQKFCEDCRNKRFLNSKLRKKVKND